TSFVQSLFNTITNAQTARTSTKVLQKEKQYKYDYLYWLIEICYLFNPVSVFQDVTKESKLVSSFFSNFCFFTSKFSEVENTSSTNLTSLIYFDFLKSR